MQKPHLKNAIILFLLVFFYTGKAEVRLPGLVSNGMVLQREQPVKIWGYADPGETIRITFLKKKYTTTATPQGEWNIVLPALPAGGPHRMTINDIILEDILIGDVWLCTGQSNSELPIRRVMDMFNNEVTGYSNSKIRLIRIPLSYNFHNSQADIAKKTDWHHLTPENSMEFSALGYFFAKDQFEKNGIPQGMISAGIGGTPAEAWISMEGLKRFPKYQNEAKIFTDDKLVEEIKKTEHHRNSAWNRVLSQSDAGLHDTVKWYEESYNDSNWTKTGLFSQEWKNDGVNPINGSHWFRRDFDIPQGFISDKITLRLGCIVDADSVFINGHFVGTTAYQYPPRIYNIPAEIIKEGKNQITIRLISYNGTPGFVEDKPYKIISGNKDIFLEGIWKHHVGVVMPAQRGGTTFQYIPTGLYNGMIAPLLNYNLAGVIWYQGESNSGKPYEYADLLTDLISDWRTKWNREDLPFLIAQLPNFMKDPPFPSESNWAEMRNAQLKVSQALDFTSLAVAIDAGEWNDIHPLDKKTIAQRLSLQAQKIVHKDHKIISDGPVYESMKIEGDKIILSFEPGTDDFQPVDSLTGFAIAGADKKYKWAKATIQDNKIIVRNDEITQPLYVRYAWGNNPEGNLYNKSGLPASPFTTEN